MRGRQAIILLIGASALASPWAGATDTCNRKKLQADAACGTAASCPSSGACSGHFIEQLMSSPGCDDGGVCSDHCVLKEKDCTKKYKCEIVDGECKKGSFDTKTKSNRADSPVCIE